MKKSIKDDLFKLFINMLVDGIITKVALLKTQKLLLTKIELTKEEKKELLKSMDKLTKQVDKNIDIVKSNLEE